MVENEKRIAVFASGNGSNAENIVQYFRAGKTAEVVLIVSNNPEAYVLERSKRLGIKQLVISKKDLQSPEMLLEKLRSERVSWIVLAGFLWLIPEELIRAYHGKIINIHPALLPKYGGKGMYGQHVHTAVSGAGETQTGITIHLVNKAYDEGAVLLQKKVDIRSGELPDAIAAKVHQLEYQYYPQLIEKLVEGKLTAEMWRNKPEKVLEMFN